MKPKNALDYSISMMLSDARQFWKQFLLFLAIAPIAMTIAELALYELLIPFMSAPGIYIVLGIAAIILFTIEYIISGLIAVSIADHGKFEVPWQSFLRVTLNYALYILIYTPAILLATLLFIIPGIVFAFFLSFAPIFLLEGESALNSISKSVNIVEKNSMQVFLVMITVPFIASLVSSIPFQISFIAIVAMLENPGLMYIGFVLYGVSASTMASSIITLDAMIHAKNYIDKSK